MAGEDGVSCSPARFWRKAHARPVFGLTLEEQGIDVVSQVHVAGNVFVEFALPVHLLLGGLGLSLVVAAADVSAFVEGLQDLPLATGLGTALDGLVMRERLLRR